MASLPLLNFHQSKCDDCQECTTLAEAVMRVSTCSRIELSMEEQVLGRNSKTWLLVISSLKELFLLDLLNMVENSFMWGL